MIELKTKLTIDQIQESQNILTLLKDDEIVAIGEQLKAGYEIDYHSLDYRRETLTEAMKIAMQIIEPKNTPWENAANIKLPIIAQAAIMYAARTLPVIIPNDKVVKSASIGADPDGAKFKRGQRYTKCMNYQNIYESPDWWDSIDKALQMLAVAGTVFFKVYFNLKKETICTELCSLDNIVVNAFVTNLDSAERITHVFKRSTNYVVSEQKKGNYIIPENIKSSEKDVNKQLDLVLQSLKVDDKDDKQPDDGFEVELAEQHMWIDLDGDMIKEPYIAVFNKKTGDMYRLVNRIKDIEYDTDQDGKEIIVGIEPEKYFTDFHFIRSSDGSFYSMGFGELLLPSTETCNTICNQLVNAGTLATNQNGIYSDDLRFEGGSYQFTLGEWKKAKNMSGEDIRKSFYPLPVQEPSQTLYNLLLFLIGVSKDLTTITDVMQGKQPLQNVSTDNYDKAIEQGSTVFTAINMRVNKGLEKYYCLQYYLNYEYLSDKKYRKIIDDNNAKVKEDFDLEQMDVKPVADASLSSEQQRLNKASVAASLRTVDFWEADHIILETLGYDENLIKKLHPPKPTNPEPSPDDQKKMADAQLAQARVGEIAAKATLDAEKNQAMFMELSKKMELMQAQIDNYHALIAKSMGDNAHNEAKNMITATKMTNEQNRKQQEFDHKQRMDVANLSLDALSKENDRLKLIIEEKKIKNDNNKSQEESENNED